jgi:hypothetical protein
MRPGGLDAISTIVSKNDHEDLLRVPTQEDRDRMNKVWEGIAGAPNCAFSPQNRMEVWKAEHSVRAERLSAARLTFAT